MLPGSFEYVLYALPFVQLLGDLRGIGLLLVEEGQEPQSLSRGMGLRFSGGLSLEESAGNFSLKAWHGADRYVEGLDTILRMVQDRFAIYRVRFQKRSAGSISISAEWYSNGKITINRAVDVDEVLISIAEMANRYADSLKDATSLRDKTLAAFEIDFSQSIDLDAFSSTVAKGKGDMNLWLVGSRS